MRVVVQKYGGSSVADLVRLRQVATRVAGTAADGTGVVVVVSAMGNTTNELLALARQVSAEPDRRELDMLLSVGERISMALLSMALRDLGVAAVSLTGSQSGIITDERHADARVVAVQPARIQAELSLGKVVIVAGFQGVSRAREVTTLGRGGSDTTAVVLAAALGAVHCEICSDVDGVWSADPRVVPDAIKLDSLPLDAALALARGGAKVLFEDALRYAHQHGVTLQASATSGPGSGTRLSVTREESRRAVAVAGDDQLALLPVAQAVAAVAAGGRLRRVSAGKALIDLRNLHGVSLAGAEAVGCVTAAGLGLGEDAHAMAAAQAALSGMEVLECGCSGDALWFVVGVAECAEATRRVHAALVSAP